MKRTSIAVLVSAVLLLGLTGESAEASKKWESIGGRAVALSEGFTCLNGNAYWSMLIRIQTSAATTTPGYLLVRFSLPCNQTPKELSQQVHVQKFRLKRYQGADEKLTEFLQCTKDSTECPPLPMWRRVPGAEGERLPFGQVIPSYLSPDFPLAPIL